ncbi:UNVERIFIED_CONTAM: hypothetical protein NCL1_21990 [Trichonephila clavipes]
MSLVGVLFNIESCMFLMLFLIKVYFFTDSTRERLPILKIVKSDENKYTVIPSNYLLSCLKYNAEDKKIMSSLKWRNGEQLGPSEKSGFGPQVGFYKG